MRRAEAYPGAHGNLAAAALVVLVAGLTIHASSRALRPDADAQATTPAGRFAPAIAQIERLISHEIEDKGLPAVSIAIVEDQQVVWTKGFGYADPDRKRPATPETVYRVGSVSKLFTDIAVMQLVERGRVDLDVPVTTYLPDFSPVNPFGTPITLRHLMSHRAGLVREPPVGHYFDASAPSLAQTVESLNRTTLVYRPGTHTKYSNAGIAVVGRVVEVLARKPFADALQDGVLEPLGLRKSAFAPLPSLTPDLAHAFMWTYHGTQFEAPTFQLGMAPAGSMYSTVTDLARFISVLFRRGAGANGPVLQPKTLEAMWTPQFSAPDARSGFGLGFNVSVFEGERRVGHNGAIYGFATELQALPESKLGVALATTLDCANPVMTHIANEAMRVMLLARNNQPVPDLTIPTAVPVEQARQLQGVYASDGAGSLELIARATRIQARLGEIRTEVKQSGEELLVDGRLAHGTRLRPQADGSIQIGSRVYRRVDRAKPDAAPSKWTGLIGEYGWDYDVLYVLEHEGKLHALIEWFYLYPFEQVAADRFVFPSSGLYDGEQLRFVRKGSEEPATAVDLGGLQFPRRPVGLKEGTFRITPAKPVAELRALAATSSPPVETGKRPADLVEVSSLDKSIKYDIRYATTNNFMSAAFYRQPRALLQRPAAEAVARAHRKLKAQGYGLLIHDAYRPWAVTKMFWEATPAAQRVFVADPSQGSRHNRGCAVDLTIYDMATGEAVQMVGGYDEFSDRSYPDYPGGTSRQRWHRELLRQVMEAEGFTVYEAEWWHFDFNSWRDYPILNIPFEAISDKPGPRQFSPRGRYLPPSIAPQAPQSTR
jgi:CubicO group peptidase (beta-lactamase class C family)/D-alanyl-D-alanine dipeptidase